MKILLASFMLAAVLAIPATAESGNPFTSGGSKAKAVIPSPPLSGIASAAMAPSLRVLGDRLAALIRATQQARSPGPLIALLALSLFYGAFHALGPGHGKTTVSAFFLARDADIRHGITVGYLLSFVHAVSALSVVMILYLVIRRTFTTDFERISRVIQLASFAIIALLGAVMTIRKILGIEHHHRHVEFRTPETDILEMEISRRPTRGELAGLALSSGIVPCPGASAVILLSLSLDMPAVSVAAVSMISIGMGVTISVVAVAAILAKRGVLKTAATTKAQANHATAVRRVVEIVGSGFLFVLGLGMFILQML